MPRIDHAVGTSRIVWQANKFLQDMARWRPKFEEIEKGSIVLLPRKNVPHQGLTAVSPGGHIRHVSLLKSLNMFGHPALVLHKYGSTIGNGSVLVAIVSSMQKL
jgi:hypothetical protein